VEKIVVAFESESTCRKMAEIIQSGGVAGCVLVHSCGEVKRLIHKLHLNLVVCGYKLADGLCEDLYADLPPTCSMLMVATPAQLELVDEDIFRLPAPVSKSSLCASIEMLYQANRRLNKYIKPRRNEEEKAVVEEAKKLLMERNGMTEEQAHRYIQKQSMDGGTRMIQTARLILGDTY
jgi:response regulator NasT